MAEACKHNKYDSQPDLKADYEAARDHRAALPGALFTVAVDTVRRARGIVDDVERLTAIHYGIICGAGSCVVAGAEVEVTPVNDGSVDNYQPPTPRESLDTPLTA